MRHVVALGLLLLTACAWEPPMAPSQTPPATVLAAATPDPGTPVAVAPFTVTFAGVALPVAGQDGYYYVRPEGADAVAFTWWAGDRFLGRTTVPVLRARFPEASEFYLRVEAEDVSGRVASDRVLLVVLPAYR